MKNKTIKKAIESYLDKGLTDKQDIYTMVVQELNVPRPTVRRCARELREDMLHKIKVLQNEIPKPESNEVYICKHGVNLIKFKCRDCESEIEATKLIRSGEID